MDLQKKLGQLAASLELLERKDRFLRAAVLELGQLLLGVTCFVHEDLVGECPCVTCTHARERLDIFAAGMQALLDEEAALVARFGGRPVLPLTRH